MHFTRSRLLQAFSIATALTVLGLAACTEPEEAPIDKPIIPTGKSAYGKVRVNVVPPTDFSQGYASVLGGFLNGATPVVDEWTRSTVSGACTLYVPNKPFCETPCGSKSQCVAPNTCKSEPDVVTVGKITANGLKTRAGATSFEMTPIANNYQVPSGTILAYPPFDEGATVTFTAAGDTASDAFTLTGKGIKPLILSQDTITLNDGQPITLTWEPATSATATNVEVEVDISHHGGTKGKISCVTPDNGSLVIAANLVTQLKALGFAGFPKVDVVRRAVFQHTSMPISLAVESGDTKQLQIPGLVSCSVNEDCPDGQICQDDMKCQ